MTLLANQISLGTPTFCRDPSVRLLWPNTRDHGMQVFSRPEGNVWVEFQKDEQMKRDPCSVGVCHGTPAAGERVAGAGHHSQDDMRQDGRVSMDTRVLLRTRQRVPAVITNPNPTRTPRSPPQDRQYLTRAAEGKTGSTQQASSPPSSGASNTEGVMDTALDTSIVVSWDNTASDRMNVTASTSDLPERKPGKRRSSLSERESHDTRRRLRLSVRVPTIAIVDAQAATKVAERLAQQLVITLNPVTGAGHEEQQMQLHLMGFDSKATPLTTGKRAN